MRGSPERRHKLVLFTLDFLFLIGAVFLSLHLRFREEAFFYLQENLYSLIIFVFLSLIFLYINGLYEFKSLIPPRKSIGRIFLALLLAYTLNLLLVYMKLRKPLGRGVLVLLIINGTVFLWIVRLLYVKFFQREFFSINLFILKEDPFSKELAEVIKNAPLSFYRVKIVSMDELMQSMQENFNGAIALRREVVPEKLSKILRFGRFQGVEIYDALQIYEELTGEVPLDYIDERYLFEASLKPSLIHIKRLKRLFDLVFSTLGILLSLPLIPLIALAIKLDSPGPVFYRQKRVGRNGRIFTLIKFRSMYVGAEEKSGPVWAKDNDERITRVGRFLRKFRLDELPQFFNVWKGEMSMVGPRPERPELLDKLIQEIPYFHDRLAMLPGLTGWAQINYPYANTLEDSKRKLQFDLYYFKNMSPLLDFLIILRTLRIIFSRLGK